METKVDKRTKEYRDTAVVQSGMDEMAAEAVNPEVCSQAGCTTITPDSKNEPCRGCIWRDY